MSVVPVNLITVADMTNLTAIADQRIALSDEPPTAAQNAAPPQQIPVPASSASQQLEMHMFPHEASDEEAHPPASDKDESGETQDRLTDRRDSNVGNHDVNPTGQANAMTVSVRDALRGEIARCWRSEPGEVGPAVTVTLVLDAAGAIAQPPQFASAALEADKPLVEAVRYAIYTCAPYRLPADRFSEWHSITLTFDPSVFRRNGRRTIGG